MLNKVITKLRKLTGHKYIALTNRCNSSILLALKISNFFSDKRFVLIPDQGGWLTYRQFPKKADLETLELKTDYGIIDPEYLKTKLSNANCLLYSHPAGYYAEQPYKQIYKTCHKEKVHIILDITGAIGLKSLGDYADILVGSFGNWKPINLGYGGFISFKDKEHYNAFLGLNYDEKFDFDESYTNRLINKINKLKNRYKLFDKAVKKIKKDLNKYEILHKKSHGINVIIKYKNEQEKQELIDYCEKNKFEYTLCPRYIRVEEQAISIEVKRLI